ncbi:nose resistant to fluoxetine protein 6-like [Watersipora subatra]|uniref:nose resistant to fluoxetine protein 6-like n=1 Tax=Watersipora subatra TaxID=2589382 RepID=UPI00355C628F
MSSEEKLMRVLSRVDWQKLMNEAVQAANQTSSSFLNPSYSQQCSDDLNNLGFALRNAMSDPASYMWALKLADAWGKFPAGLLQARFTWPGDMDECEAVRGDRFKVLNSSTGGVEVIEKGALKGAYTMAHLEVAMPGASVIAGSLMMSKSGKVPMNWGICLPASCNYVDIWTFMKRLEVIGTDVPYLLPHSEAPAVKGTWKTDPKFIGVSVFFGLTIGIIAFCTVIDRLVLLKMEERKKRQKSHELTDLNGVLPLDSKEKGMDNGAYVHNENHAEVNGNIKHGAEAYEDSKDLTPAKKATNKPGIGIMLLKSFSLYENLPKLLDSTSKPNQLQALDGIRFLSMTWVIIGHVYSFIAFGPYTQNLAVAGDFAKDGDWTFMGVVGGLFAVDSFFLLSGLLVGYLFLKMMAKIKGKVSCFMMTMYYVHRYIRLLPLYGAAILISVAYTNYLGRGPLNTWYSGELKNFCDTNWWTNLLYINNVYKDKEMCHAVTWYLANDMQFYVISPLILIPLYWLPGLGFAAIFGLWFVSLGVTGYEWGKRSGGSQITDPEVFNDIYIKPWCRIGPYLIGLILAYILFKKVKVKSRIMQAIWWVTSLGIIALVVYIPYDATKENGLFSSSWNSTQRGLYETLCKNAWALALGWIIFASNTGCGGFIGDALSWGGWAPLSKLTYAAYLLHPFMLDLNYKNRRNLIYVGHDSLIFDDIAFITITYMASFLFHLVIEAPMLGIEKIILPRK